MTRVRKELAEKITSAIFNYDPYNGADYDDVFQASAAELKTIEGCYNIITELTEMLNNI